RVAVDSSEPGRGAVLLLLRHAPRHDGTCADGPVVAERSLSLVSRRAGRVEPGRAGRLLGLPGRATANARGVPRHGARRRTGGVSPRGGEREPLRRDAVTARGV